MSEPPAGRVRPVAYPPAEHAPTPAHPRTHATHTLDINSPRLSSFGKKTTEFAETPGFVPYSEMSTSKEKVLLKGVWFGTVEKDA